MTIKSSLKKMEKRIEVIAQLCRIIDEHPNEAVQVIRFWMNEDFISKQELELRAAIRATKAMKVSPQCLQSSPSDN